MNQSDHGEGLPSSEQSQDGCRSSAHLLRTARPRRLRACSSVVQALGWHVTMRLADSRVIAKEPWERRVAAFSLLELAAAFGLIAFHLVDTHLHALIVGSRERAGVFARRIEGTLHARLRLGCPFEAARFSPVGDQARLASTFAYVLDQAERHQLVNDPLREGSSLPDLVGLRVVHADGIAHCARRHLPRLRPEEFAARYLPAPCTTKLDCAQLAEAAAAVLALPHLRTRAPRAVLAKHAAVVVGLAEGFSVREIAGALGLSTRRIERLRRTPPPAAAVVQATRWQLRLRS